MSKLAIALDIGTTNINSALIDTEEKKVLLTLDVANEQVAHGDDVITRLKFATTNKDGIKELHKKLINSVDNLLSSLLSQARVKKSDVKTILAVGNAAMYHLTLLLPVDKLASAPFLPSQTQLVRKAASSIGLRSFSKAEFIFMPNIGGFVGSDAIAVILAEGINKSKDINLAIDLGTNGEVILGNKERILVASTAAGPAFEGWHISCGTRPSAGAIISFGMNGEKITLKTIDDITPTGTASSGLIEVISAMIKEGYIDKTGRLKNNEFIIYKDKEKKISINQKDIREIQLAKSAIHTAVKLLKDNYKIEYSDIKNVTLTGRFGFSLKKEDLVTIGLIPEDLRNSNAHFIGNLALEGASSIILKDRMDEVDSILNITKHVELQNQRNFQDEFARGLHFNRTLT